MSDALFDSLLTQTCTIKSRTYNTSSVDDWGVPSETIEETGTTASCLIQLNSETVEMTIRGKKEMASHLGFFKYSVSIQQDDIVELDGVAYQVLSVDDPVSQNHHKEVQLKRIENI
jgi:hypothetical protein